MIELGILTERDEVPLYGCDGCDVCASGVLLCDEGPFIVTVGDG